MDERLSRLDWLLTTHATPSNDNQSEAPQTLTIEKKLFQDVAECIAVWGVKNKIPPAVSGALHIQCYINTKSYRDENPDASHARLQKYTLSQLEELKRSV